MRTGAHACIQIQQTMGPQNNAFLQSQLWPRSAAHVHLKSTNHILSFAHLNMRALLGTEAADILGGGT